MSDVPGEGGSARDAARSAAARAHRAGLCATCLHHRTTGNRKGSIFYLCMRSKTDPRYQRYPPLPVLECAGWEEGGEDLRQDPTEEGE